MRLLRDHIAAVIGEDITGQRTDPGHVKRRLVIGVAPEQGIGRRDLVIRADAVLVVIAIGALGGDVVASANVGIRYRRVSDKILRHCGEARPRNAVAGEGRAGERVENRRRARTWVLLGGRQTGQIA